MSMEKVGNMLKELGLPARDRYDLPSSTKTFPDGAHYRMEVSGVERPEVLKALIEERNRRGVPIHRIIAMVMGTTLLDDVELKDFAQMAVEERLEVIVTPGPRSSWDVGRQITTPEGGLSGLNFRGADQLNFVIDDIMRCIELGFRGFLVVDEGLMWALNELREKGYIPEDVVFKVSIYAGCGSPAGAHLLESLGANTFNPLGDLSLPQFASLRAATSLPIDVHVYLAESFGGYARFYETPELARICAPCYFKIEPGPACAISTGLYKPWTSIDLLSFLAREKVKYAEIIHQIIQKNNKSLKLSEQGPEDLAIPKP